MPRATPRNTPSMTVSFSPGHASFLEKVTRVEIDNRNEHSMFFYSCNPDPATKINESGALLAERSLYSQWHWLKEKLTFYASLLSTRAAFMLIMPEVTRDGNIHFHAIVKPHNDFDEHDIKRTFWQVMECDITKAKVRKHAVNIKAITDSAVVDYLFNKDAHDYETIFKRKVNNEEPYKPLLLTVIHNNNPAYSDSDSSEESEEDSFPMVTKTNWKKRHQALINHATLDHATRRGATPP